MIVLTEKEVYSDSGKIVRRISDGSHFRRATLLPGETAESFAEAESVPEVPETDYNGEVNSLIRTRYSLSEELALLRQRDTKPEEFAEYSAYAERCKTEAKAAMRSEGGKEAGL